MIYVKVNISEGAFTKKLARHTSQCKYLRYPYERKWHANTQKENQSNGSRKHIKIDGEKNR